MKIYWTLSSVPELASLPRKERGVIWRACYYRTFRQKNVWFGLIAGVICVGLGSSLGREFGHGSVGETVGVMVGAGIGCFIFFQVAIRAALPAIRIAVKRTNGKVT